MVAGVLETGNKVAVDPVIMNPSRSSSSDPKGVWKMRRRRRSMVVQLGEAFPVFGRFYMARLALLY
jgi:hypothetical protein